MTESSGITKEHAKLEEKLVKSLMADRRSDRRWRNFRFFVYVAILLLYASIIINPPFLSKDNTAAVSKKPYVALLRLNGVIMPQSGFSAEKIIPQLNAAFTDKQAKGVVLLINSPGGSPVQASIIHDKILDLKKRYKKKVIVVGEDTLASGAYLVATAADKIYVNQDTLTGSIGVIMNGFGFVDAIDKLGVTRRVFTAGGNKDRLDPFKPLNTADTDKVRSVLDAVHQSFIQDVIDGRGNKLKGNRQELFSGDFWTGAQAQKLGLVDGTENLWTVLQDQFGVRYYRDYTRKPSLLRSLLGGVNSELNLGLFNHQAPLRAELVVN